MQAAESRLHRTAGKNLNKKVVRLTEPAEYGKDNYICPKKKRKNVK